MVKLSLYDIEKYSVAIFVKRNLLYHFKQYLKFKKFMVFVFWNKINLVKAKENFIVKPNTYLLTNMINGIDVFMYYVNKHISLNHKCTYYIFYFI